MATPVTDILQQILTAQGRRTIAGAEAVRRILEAVRKQVIGEIASAAPESFTAYRQTQMLAQINHLLYEAEAGIRVELGRGINAAWEAGTAMLPQMAQAAGITLSPVGISSHLVSQLKEFASDRLDYWKNDLTSKIRAQITLGVLGQKTPHEISAAIAGTLESPSIFRSIAYRAEVVTRTEMGRVFSNATQLRLDQAALVVPGMEKEWIHAGHPMQPRPTHLAAHGQRVPVDEPFQIGAQQIMYPRDPAAPLSEVINCGCDHVPWNPNWGTETVAVRKAPLAFWD